MKIGILGTGTVGETIGTKLVELGHTVTMGSRDAANVKAAAWVKKAGKHAAAGTFKDAATAGEIVFNCTSGQGSVAAVTSAGEAALRGKVLIDVSNPLDFTKGPIPILSVGNTDSLGEQLQKAVPSAKVVKTLNTLGAPLMVNPRSLADSHNLFICGDDDGAKAKAVELLRSFGWRDDDIVDLGDITAARGVEAYVLLWVRIYRRFGSANFNLKLVRGK